MNKEEIVAHRTLLQKQLWSVADDLRGHMDANEYQKYILGILFYKYLSEMTSQEVQKVLVNENLTYEEAWSNPDAQILVAKELSETLGFVIQPGYLFDNLVDESRKGIKGTWSTDLFKSALNKVIESTVGTPSQEKFEGLFDDIDLDSSKLGASASNRTSKLASIIQKINEIDFKLDETEIDILGDAYEYLISQFAATAGKKGGEFYTPQAISKLIASILSYEKPDFETVYDPTCGSGSLLLRVARETRKRKELVSLYGQELNTTTYNSARMNMFMHNVPIQNWHIANGNTLEDDLHRGIQVDVIAANPPYSAEWEHTEALEQDPRYAPYGRLAPKSYADYAFIVNMLHHLNSEGVAAVVLPHGVLFRGGAEGVIRKKIIEDNLLHAIIGLPANLFFGTNIPTAIVVFKKGRSSESEVLFIDASKQFTKGKNQNFLEHEHLEEIMSSYSSPESSLEFSRSVPLEELKKNDYNLNISRYIEKIEVQEYLNLGQVTEQLLKIELEQRELEDQISKYLRNVMMGITHTEELVKIVSSNGFRLTDVSEINEPGLFFFVKKPSRSSTEKVAHLNAQDFKIKPVSISGFLGYKWGDAFQDKKVQKFYKDYDFYLIKEEIRNEKTFEEHVLQFLKEIGVRALKRQEGVIGISPLLRFSSDPDAAWSQFELDFQDAQTEAGMGAYFLAYPHLDFIQLGE